MKIRKPLIKRLYRHAGESLSWNVVVQDKLSVNNCCIWMLSMDYDIPGQALHQKRAACSKGMTTK